MGGAVFLGLEGLSGVVKPPPPGAVVSTALRATCTVQAPRRVQPDLLRCFYLPRSGYRRKLRRWWSGRRQTRKLWPLGNGPRDIICVTHFARNANLCASKSLRHVTAMLESHAILLVV